jgi:hypothetical protein
MEADTPKQDVIVYTMGEIIDCRRFREKTRREAGFDENASGPEAKQRVVSRVMERLDELHEEAEEERKRCLTALDK